MRSWSKVVKLSSLTTSQLLSTILQRVKSQSWSSSSKISQTTSRMLEVSALLDPSFSKVSSVNNTLSGSLYSMTKPMMTTMELLGWRITKSLESSSALPLLRLRSQHTELLLPRKNQRRELSRKREAAWWTQFETLKIRKKSRRSKKFQNLLSRKPNQRFQSAVFNLFPKRFLSHPVRQIPPVASSWPRTKPKVPKNWLKSPKSRIFSTPTMTRDRTYNS